MSVTRILAQAAVSDIERAVSWYSIAFDRKPDARPMEGLVEWHLGPSFGVQVWYEPARAGMSAMVLSETDLDALATRLTAKGLEHGGVERVTASRILQLADPDGNRIVITGE
jgi:predicted enzyme related to lactoylglutathione lyase